MGRIPVRSAHMPLTESLYPERSGGESVTAPERARGGPGIADLGEKWTGQLRLPPADQTKDGTLLYW